MLAPTPDQHQPQARSNTTRRFTASEPSQTNASSSTSPFPPDSLTSLRRTSYRLPTLQITIVETNANPPTHRLPLGRDLVDIIGRHKILQPLPSPAHSFLLEGSTRTTITVRPRDRTSAGGSQDFGQVVDGTANVSTGVAFTEYVARITC
ncbi:hypothetical protein BKA70DRAFT_513881 [Coprinopsis sp. MPI-PUGE-AT-0042]|nr:hypothetical protein BKA70DRAFT_513881 [Coprinopsis sp. MPI-PUGE-AT-0042]